MMTRFASLVFLCLLLTGCLLEGGPERGPAISLSDPEVGQTDVFTRYTYGFEGGSGTKSYTGDSLTLSITDVDSDSIGLVETACWTGQSGCQATRFTLSRESGKAVVRDSAAFVSLAEANVFPKGILSEDFGNEIEFQGHSPVTEGPEAGFKKEYSIRGGEFQDVIVLADPTMVPVDGGGRAFILTKERRILDMYSYMVFGIDGGWELDVD